MGWEGGWAGVWDTPRAALHRPTPLVPAPRTRKAYPLFMLGGKE